MAFEAEDLDRRVVALLHLEQSDEPIGRVDDIVIGMPSADMPELINAFIARAYADDKKPVSVRAELIHDRLVDRGASMAVARLL